MAEIKALNKEFRKNFNEMRAKWVKSCVAGTKQNLWKAVRLARDLTLGRVPVVRSEIANTFAKHFSEKIKLNVSKAVFNANGVYNGRCKLSIEISRYIVATLSFPIYLNETKTSCNYNTIRHQSTLLELLLITR